MTEREAVIAELAAVLDARELLPPEAVECLPLKTILWAGQSDLTDRVQAVGGTPPYTFGVMDPTKLPSGLAIVSDGRFAGWAGGPAHTEYAALVRATDATGAHHDGPVTIYVRAAGDVVIS